MTKSPRPPIEPGRTTKQPPEFSAFKLVAMTMLDTTWRAFVPTIGGVLLGIGLDSLFNIAPIATIFCLTAGTLLSLVLIVAQLRNIKDPIKK